MILKLVKTSNFQGNGINEKMILNEIEARYERLVPDNAPHDREICSYLQVPLGPFPRSWNFLSSSSSVHAGGSHAGAICEYLQPLDSASAIEFPQLQVSSLSDKAFRNGRKRI